MSDERKKVIYRGPEEYRIVRWQPEDKSYAFDKDVVVDCPVELAKELVAMKFRNHHGELQEVPMELAKDYGAQYFDLVDDEDTEGVI